MPSHGPSRNFHLLDSPESWDRHGSMGPTPIQGNGCCRHFPSRCNAQKPLAHRLGPPFESSKEQASGAGRPRRRLPVGRGQPSQGQRAVSNQRHPEFTAHLSYASREGRLWGKERELNLKTGQVDTALGQVAMHPTQPLRTKVGESQLRHLACQHQISQSIQKGPFLPWGVAGGAPMQLDAIQLALQPCMGSGKRTVEPMAAKTPWEGSQLGGQPERLPTSGRQSRTPAAKQGLAAT